MFKIRKHTIFPEEFPENWASDWGEDEFGLWMAFTYKDVRQAFRWCEPGTFLMGSPSDEPERFDNELQHQVTLTRGFWIADTTVTQGLWQVIMGNNPSEFRGDENPLENISWDDARAFITKMNGIKAELKLCLPTEAQWEYACRAGTTTTFSWGEQIDTSLVNFKIRQERTVVVKALPCNNWGLYQMHGNVWEWCQDWFGEYPAESVINPKGPETGAGRVLRGGSWVGSGRACRSANRGHSDPSIRRSIIGFRLARDR